VGTWALGILPRWIYCFSAHPRHDLVIYPSLLGLSDAHNCGWFCDGCWKEGIQRKHGPTCEATNDSLGPWFQHLEVQDRQGNLWVFALQGPFLLWGYGSQLRFFIYELVDWTPAGNAERGFLDLLKELGKSKNIKNTENRTISRGRGARKGTAHFMTKGVAHFQTTPEWLIELTGLLIRGFKNDPLCTGDCHRQFSTHYNFGILRDVPEFYTILACQF
jgi:hypothetical protein